MLFFFKFKTRATVVCSQVIKRFRESKSGLQTEIEGNTSTLNGNTKNGYFKLYDITVFHIYLISKCSVEST